MHVSIWLWIGLFILVLTLLFLFSSIRIELRYFHKREKDEGAITFSTLRNLIRYQVKIPEISFEGLDRGVRVKTTSTFDEDEKRLTKEKVERFRKLSIRMVKQINHFYRIIRTFVQQITCEKFDWETCIGIGNAAETGIAVGMMWGAKMTFVSCLGSRIQWTKPPIIRIQPHFTESIFETRIHSIIRFRIGHAILAMSRLLVQLIMNRRDMKWSNIQSKV